MDYSVVNFDHVRVPASALLGFQGLLSPEGEFRDPHGAPERVRRNLQIRERAWIGFCCQLAAVGRAGTAIAIRYASQRQARAFEGGSHSIIEYRAGQRALFGALATAYAVTFLVNRVARAWLGEAGDGDWAAGPAFGRSLGVARAIAAREVERALGVCAVRIGAQGIFACNRIAEYQGLAHILFPAAGDGALVSIAAARSMACGDHYNPPAEAEDAACGSDVSQPSFWLRLARIRERGLHAQLVARLEHNGGRTEHELWNDCDLLGQELVEAYNYRMTLEQFVAACAGRPESPLADLCTLYALENAESALVWHLAAGDLTLTDASRVPDLINDLCCRIAPHALVLADAFGLPSELLGAPIQQANYVDYFAVRPRPAGVGPLNAPKTENPYWPV
jgi:acyl-CoA oxidase